MKKNTVNSNRIEYKKEYKEAEWVFQFDDDDPVIFAWSDDDKGIGEINITLKSNSESNVIFYSPDKSKLFRLYSRPISESTKLLRETKK
jgi:hypothetical protein